MKNHDPLNAAHGRDRDLILTMCIISYTVDLWTAFILLSFTRLKAEKDH